MIKGSLFAVEERETKPGKPGDVLQTPMLHTNNPIIKHKAGLLKLAQEL